MIPDYYFVRMADAFYLLAIGFIVIGVLVGLAELIKALNINKPVQK